MKPWELLGQTTTPDGTDLTLSRRDREYVILADGNILVDASIYDAFLQQLQAEGGYLVKGAEKALLEQAYWDADGRRTADRTAEDGQRR